MNSFGFRPDFFFTFLSDKEPRPSVRPDRSGISGGSNALKKGFKGGGTGLLLDPLDFSKICAISKPSRDDGENVCAAATDGGQKIKLSFATRFKTAEMRRGDRFDNDVAPTEDQSQKNAFCSSERKR